MSRQDFVAFGEVTLCAVFDRPKTVALKWAKNGAPQPERLDRESGGLGEGLVLQAAPVPCREDLQPQLCQWLQEVNHERPSRATAEVPELRRQQELPRLRPLRVSPERAGAAHADSGVSDRRGELRRSQLRHAPRRLPSMAGTLYLYRDHVHIVAGRYQAEHPRYIAKGTVSRQPEHRAAQLAAVSGKRGRRYLQREHLLETGEAALRFLTELVHRDPRSWYRDAEILHRLLQQHGPKKRTAPSRPRLARTPAPPSVSSGPIVMMVLHHGVTQYTAAGRRPRLVTPQSVNRAATRPAPRALGSPAPPTRTRQRQRLPRHP